MNSLLYLGLPMLCYLAQSADYVFMAGRIGMGLAMAGYSIGNVGLILDRYGI